MAVRYFILDNSLVEPIEASFDQWSEQMSSAAHRLVAQDDVGRFLVSTIFTGLAVSLRANAPPLLWETMVFEDGNPSEVAQERYTSRAEALAGHATMLSIYKKKADT